MKIFMQKTIILIFFLIPSLAITQSWYRNDYTFTLENISQEEIDYGTYELYVITSSYSKINQFYFDKSQAQYVISSEVMPNTEDPYLLIDAGDTVMGLQLSLDKNNSKKHHIVKMGKLVYSPGFYKTSSWEATNNKTIKHWQDHPKFKEIEMVNVHSPVIKPDKEKNIKYIDKYFDYAYLFNGFSKKHPQSKRIYKLDVIN